MRAPCRLWVAWLTFACGPTASIQGGGTESDSSASADDGDGDGADGPVVSGDAVDCSTLPSDSPTVAGGAMTALGFPEYKCDPRQSPANAGNTEYTCCSTDPAAASGALPNYDGKNIAPSATPYFSGDNNALGTQGTCVRTADIPTGSGLLEPSAMNCPIPCNPTWGRTEVDVVCGATRVCCQVHALQAPDCVHDATTGLWRAVTGDDIGVLVDGEVITDWSSAAHATHQDRVPDHRAGRPELRRLYGLCA